MKFNESGSPRRDPSFLPRVAWALCSLSAAALVASSVLYIVNVDHRQLVTLVDPIAALSGIAYAFLGALIVARHHHHGLGWLFLGIGLTLGLSMLAFQVAILGLGTSPGSVPGVEWALWLGFWLSLPAFMLQPTLVLLLFPTGRFIGRTSWVIGMATVISALVTLATVVLSGYAPRRSGSLLERVPSPVPDVQLPGLLDPYLVTQLMIVCAVASITLLVRRLSRARGIERQQLKWAAYAMVLVVVAFIVAVANDADVVERVLGAPIIAVTGLVFSVALALVPIIIGMAILRHHLFDIDRVISRTLVYGTLTAGLAGIYLGGVLLLQRLFDPFTASSDISIAGTTLLVAALARPLRNRIQRAVDRRFYRRHYDAESEIARFAGRLREQTDLDALSREIVNIVHWTMQPNHVSLWILPKDVAPRNRS